MKKSPRYVVMEMLMRVYDGGYSNLVLDSVLSSADFDGRDKAFAARLFYGVTERMLTLDHIISLYSKKPLRSLDKSVLAVLRMGIYQLLYMDSVPDSAAVNESVDIIKKCGKSSASGFVNAVLRGFIRDNKSFPLPKDPIKRLSVEYSFGEALAARLVKQYGREKAEEFMKASLEPHKLYLSVNNTKITADALIEKFGEIGIKAYKTEYDENCLCTEAFGSVEKNELFERGYYHVQDLSSRLCCKALSPKAGEKILDICAAPGGKSFTIAELTNDSCEITSCDLHKKRAELVRKGAERLGLQSIKALQNDAKVYNSDFPQFDRILCDVPCSGTGVVRSKPEIKYISLENAAGLPEIQYQILETAARYLKIGGTLVYSTCTILKEENDEVIDRFLSSHSDFEGVPFLEELGSPFGGYKTVIFPNDMGCEGFFISCVRRIK